MLNGPIASPTFQNAYFGEYSNSSYKACLPGDGPVEREHEEGDAQLDLLRSLCCHVLHPRGQHKVQL